MLCRIIKFLWEIYTHKLEDKSIELIQIISEDCIPNECIFGMEYSATPHLAIVMNLVFPE
ncbi:hypothetical protein LCGC14_2365850 [marine sediment metagenome]|uniref:Uncharacterized protein n=1 Tax=marine sediment metagenome TaxID=412755 RepID=A0A0F9EHQ5_9ZZZZ